MNRHFGMRLREPLKIVAVAGEDLSSAGFDCVSYDKCVHGRN
jgi:hypothetical protein